MRIFTLLDAIHALVNESRSLTAEEAQESMGLVLSGRTTPVQISAFLVALTMKGETVEELTGFARAMRAAAVPLKIPDPVLDTCGTGGDGLCTFNISTTAAFVIAGAGVRVAKHGNRSISSRCGSADVLEHLGVDTSDPERAIRDIGIGFLFAPTFHPAMRHVQPVRRDLKLRTVFNLLGPLTNPAGSSVQVAGAFSRRAAELLACSLAALGLKRGFVVHGDDGLDEVTTTGPTLIYSIEHGRVDKLVYTPEDFGVPRAQLEDLAGGNPEYNAFITRDILAGAEGPRRDVVLVNAALALIAAGKCAGIAQAMGTASESIDSGAAQAKLVASSAGKS